MHNNKLVACIMVNNIILREINKDQIVIPFGSEYSIYLKNLNDVNAYVDVYIDGTSVSDGMSIEVRANSSVTLSRSIKNGNMQSGNSFKFIQMTDQISSFRGNKAEDGIVQIKFRYAKVQPRLTISEYFNKRTDGIGMLHSSGIGYGGIVNMSATSGHIGSPCGEVVIDAPEICSLPFPEQKELLSGITVPGSVNNQTFTRTTSPKLEDEQHTMVFMLSGIRGEFAVSEPVTVKQKVICPTCGTPNVSSNNFCPTCGTALT